MSPLPRLPTFKDNLALFVGELRDLLFSSQAETGTYFHLDRAQISRYETGKSIPKLGYVAGLIQLLAERSGNDPEVQRDLLQEMNKVAASRHYHKRRFQDWPALCQVAEKYLAKQRQKTAHSSPTPTSETQIGETWQVRLERWPDIPPDTSLIGAQTHLGHLLEKIISAESGWVICLDGLGGIGKTSLANALIRQPELPQRFRDFAWVSAKQQHLTLGVGLEEVTDPVRDTETLIEALLSQLGNPAALAQPPAQKKAVLSQLLKDAPYFIVIDNLESLSGYQTLVSTLLKFCQPSKFLLTSRHSLRAYPGVYNYTLTELSRADTLSLLTRA